MSFKLWDWFLNIFGATSFCQNVISSNRRFAESLFLRKKKIAESHLTESSHGRIVELAKHHNAERNISESFFSRTSFSGIVVQPNVIFRNLCSAERLFPESLFSWTSFLRIVVQPNVPFRKRCSAKRHFYESSSSRTSFSRNVISSNFAETQFRRNTKLPKVIWPNRHTAESSNYQNFIMPNDIFPNRCSAERHFLESLFSRSFGNFAVFGKTMIRWNDVSGKERGPNIFYYLFKFRYKLILFLIASNFILFFFPFYQT